MTSCTCYRIPQRTTVGEAGSWVDYWIPIEKNSPLPCSKCTLNHDIWFEWECLRSATQIELDEPCTQACLPLQALAIAKQTTELALFAIRHPDNFPDDYPGKSIDWWFIDCGENIWKNSIYATNLAQSIYLSEYLDRLDELESIVVKFHKKAIEEGWQQFKYYYIYNWKEPRADKDHFDNLCSDRLERFTNPQDYLAEVLTILEEGKEQLIVVFDRIHEHCASLHFNPTTYYNMGRAYYEKGDIATALSIAEKVIEKGGENLNSQVFCGVVFNEAHLYHQATKALDSAILNDPKNKEAYFQRALAYFETGQYDIALADYVNSAINPKSHDPSLILSQLKWTQGVFEGLVKGGVVALESIGSSLLDLTQGSARALWAFTQEPIDASVKAYNRGTEAAISFCHITHDLFSYLSTHSLKETASDSWHLARRCIPELDELITNWDILGDHEKGEKDNATAFL